MLDLDVLSALERELFATHRISRRSFRRFLASARATLIVVEGSRQLAGYALVLYRSHSKLARLYSIGVALHYRGRGLARRLLAAMEQNARQRGCAAMRLEVRENDCRAIALYEKAGYGVFGRHARYYDEHVSALRFEKRLGPQARGRRSKARENI